MCSMSAAIRFRTPVDTVCADRRSVSGCTSAAPRLHSAQLQFTATHIPCEKVNTSKLQLSCSQLFKGKQTSPKRKSKANRALVQNNTSVFSGELPGGEPVSSSGSGQLRVAVDVDEVLARFLLTLNKFCAEEYGMNFDVADYDVYDFKTIWDCSQTESNEKVHAFFESHHFANGIPAIPGAFASLQRLKSQCELVVVTSRQHVIQEPTLEWLEMHFPGVFSEVHFGNHYALHGPSRKKSEICQDLGAAMLIDDNPQYALECAEAGIQVLLFDWGLLYPWSKTSGGGPRHPLITRVSDWAAVEAVIGSLTSPAGTLSEPLASPTAPAAPTSPLG